MKQEKAHGDYFYLPPDDNSQHDPTQVEQKDATYVQGRRGVLDYPYDASEYYAKQSYDFLDENRGLTANTAINTIIDFKRIIKQIWITCPTGSASSLYVNFDGQAANAAGSIQIVAGETRTFVIGARKIFLCGDAVGQAGFRVTWGF